MTPQVPQLSVKSSGFTTLQEGGAHPDCDIVFIHGLNGKPDKSWTYSAHASEKKKERSIRRQASKLFGKDKTNIQVSVSEIKENSDVFWPRDLLSQEDCCKTARIMTYGYDSDVLKLVENANFSTITTNGESLLNGLARIREDSPRRPLMLIAHSLGGLVVKSALNQSAIENSQDLRAVAESTFAIIFFGTPHRGSGYAEIGNSVAKAASMLAMRRYNDRILTNLARNTEILSQLRKTFSTHTIVLMKQTSSFEASSFQENRGFSSAPNFRGKASSIPWGINELVLASRGTALRPVVDDDSSELGDGNRNDHIDKNHMEMVTNFDGPYTRPNFMGADVETFFQIRFPGRDDPEYEKVIGEIKRHLDRIRRVVDKQHKNLCKSLELTGKNSWEHWNQIKSKTPGTLRWLYHVHANTSEKRKSRKERGISLQTWLAEETGIFWITGGSGPGRSTAMKYLSSDNKTIRYLQSDAKLNYSNGQSSGHASPATVSEYITGGPDNSGIAKPRYKDWCIVKLFVTSKGTGDQDKWSTMLQGILWQLVNSRPELSKLVMNLARENNVLVHESAQSTARNALRETYKWSPDIVEQAIEVCKAQTHYPLRVLVMLDALDEIQNEEDIRQCVTFLKRLSELSPSSRNIFKVCISSRSGQRFLNLLAGTWRINMDDHSIRDIPRKLLSPFH
ncbi:hypothetical protein F5B22DRAFT_652969 [Xylaria bambusicola]|uniref:uncharacterized protein n=1 Tax=Xylaria bambusicola TaxID=326684 RepID=UPI0020084ED0|nr:uncharacterized protein F5B22DRAFT_652969 [Xylaria bambusicola]KAI0527849.1 hypothetical protein F5B22DRAFT_652969 [Xylaria bambusicola]